MENKFDETAHGLSRLLLNYSCFQSFIIDQTHIEYTLRLYTEISPWQISPAFSDHRDFILLVCTVACFYKNNF